MSKAFGMHWFRRDLRVAGNPGLKYQMKKFDGSVVGLFCFDSQFLARDDFSHNRFQFFLNTLETLKSELQGLGSDLLVLDEAPQKAIPRLIEYFKGADDHLKLLTWCRDYEPYACSRDQEIKTICNEKYLDLKTFKDHLLVEPPHVHKEGDPKGAYQVYSPFAKRWLGHFQSESIQSEIEKQKTSLTYLRSLSKGKIKQTFKLSWRMLIPPKQKKHFLDQLSDFQNKNKKKVNITIPEAGSVAAYNALTHFEKSISEYGKLRDVPSEDGTSKFSFFLKNGSLTHALIAAHFNFEAYGGKAQTGKEKFFSELIWREFYYHILYWHPRVENEAFLEKYKKLKWENNEKLFEKWKTGMTGFPLVDAGMRQLNETGWMHNRIRMVVASFLTKDLLIDWRWGEKYFMEKLLDGDLAANNGGWQWAASTGCDPQPYFRIFNPWSQSKKHDSDGIYIKKFVPELEDLDAKKLHQPIMNHDVYPAPCVDHKDRREKALKMYKGV